MPEIKAPGRGQPGGQGGHATLPARLPAPCRAVRIPTCSALKQFHGCNSDRNGPVFHRLHKPFILSGSRNKPPGVGLTELNTPVSPWYPPPLRHTNPAGTPGVTQKAKLRDRVPRSA